MQGIALAPPTIPVTVSTAPGELIATPFISYSFLDSFIKLIIENRNGTSSIGYFRRTDFKTYSR